MKLIVDGYVKLGPRKELDDLKAHHCRLASELRSRRGGVFDLSSSINQLDDEIVASRKASRSWVHGRLPDRRSLIPRAHSEAKRLQHLRRAGAVSLASVNDQGWTSQD